MSESTTLRARGLYTFQNALSEIPEGALIQADNVVIDSEGVVSPRRGNAVYGGAMGSLPTNIAKQLLTYKGRILRHWNSTLDYDSDGSGTFVTLSSSVTEPDSNRRIRYVEANGNLYFTTSQGIKKISASSASGVASAGVVNAGGIKALDGYAELSDSTGFFTQETACAYRIVWGYKDANNNVILGTPSSRIVIYNSMLPLLISDFNSLIADLNTVATTSLASLSRSCTVTNGSAVITTESVTNLSVGMTVSGSGIPTLARITSISDSTPTKSFTINQNVSTTSSASVAKTLSGNASFLATSVPDWLSAGSLVFGTGIPAGATVVSYNTNAVPQVVGSNTYNFTVTISTAATQSGEGVSISFTKPTESVVLSFGQQITDATFPSLAVPTSATSKLIYNSLKDLTTKLDDDLKITTNGSTVKGVVAKTATAVTSGSDNVTIADSTDLVVGMTVSGIGIPDGTRIETITGSAPTITLNLSQQATSSGSPILTFINTSADKITGIQTTSILAVGMTVTGTGIPDNTKIISIDSTSQVTVSNPCTATGTSSITFDAKKFSSLIAGLWEPYDPATSEQLLSIQQAYDIVVSKLNEINAFAAYSLAQPNVEGSFSASTQSSTVNVKFQIPENITSSHFYQVYRSSLAISSGPSYLYDVVPDDELQLIVEDFPTSATPGAIITFYDTVLESFRAGGAYLYTNSNSGEGILQANEPPPIAKDIALFKGTTFYANTVSKNSLSLSLLPGNLSTDLLGKVLTITQGSNTNSYTFVAAGTAGAGEIEISTAATPAQQVDETARNIVLVVNSNESEVVNAFYLSGASDIPGLMRFEEITPGGGSFHITLSGSGSQFSPELPITGTSASSTGEVTINRIYYSKYQQPEAVPLLNYLDVGPKDKEIIRIVPLRDSLFILTQGGVYRLSGESGGFQVTLFDSSAQLKAPDTAVVLNNQIYMLTDQGVAVVSDTGVSVISRPIEDQLLPIAQHTNFSNASFGVSYESDRSYMVWTVTNPTDTVATQCFRYNTFTSTWVRWPISKTSGIVVPETMVMYLGASDTNHIEKERKSFSRLDFADREEVVTMPNNAMSGNTINFGYVVDLYPGDVIAQTQYLTISKFNRLLFKLDRDAGIKYSDFSSLYTVSPGENIADKISALASRLDEAGSGTSGKGFLAAVNAVANYPNTFLSHQNAFNSVVTLLNSDAGTSFTNYETSTGTTSLEAIVTDVNAASTTVTLSYAPAFLIGSVTAYHGIETIVTWAPHHFGSPSVVKHIRESTILFNTAAFTNAIASFSSDLSPGFEDIEFEGEGNGSWGSFSWGMTTWGGEGTSRPFRTYVPRTKQRCRYIEPRFTHTTALEKFAIFGVSFTWDAVSSRGYR